MNKHKLLYASFWTAIRRTPDADGGGAPAPSDPLAGASVASAPAGADAAVDQADAQRTGAAGDIGSPAAEAATAGSAAGVGGGAQGGVAASPAAPDDPASAPAPVVRSGDPTATLATALRSHAAFHAELAEHGPSIGWPGKLIEMCRKAGADMLAAAEHFEQWVVNDVRQL